MHMPCLKHKLVTRSPVQMQTNRFGDGKFGVVCCMNILPPLIVVERRQCRGESWGWVCQKYLVFFTFVSRGTKFAGEGFNESLWPDVASEIALHPQPGRILFQRLRWQTCLLCWAVVTVLFPALIIILTWLVCSVSGLSMFVMEHHSWKDVGRR